jgi:hypothetical protein
MSGFPLVNCGSRPDSRRSSSTYFRMPIWAVSKAISVDLSFNGPKAVARLRQSSRKNVRLPDCSQSLVATCRRKGIDSFRKNIAGDVIEKLWHCAESCGI